MMILQMTGTIFNNMRSMVISIVRIAKHKNIPVFLYNNYNNYDKWVRQNKNKTINIKDIEKFDSDIHTDFLDRFNTVSKNINRRHDGNKINYMNGLLELIYKNNLTNLTNNSMELIQILNTLPNKDFNSELRSIGTKNSKKRSKLEKIIKFMT